MSVVGSILYWALQLFFYAMLARFVEFPEACITIGMQHTPEGRQMGSWMLAFAVG